MNRQFKAFWLSVAITFPVAIGIFFLSSTAFATGLPDETVNNAKNVSVAISGISVNSVDYAKFVGGVDEESEENEEPERNVANEGNEGSEGSQVTEGSTATEGNNANEVDGGNEGREMTEGDEGNEGDEGSEENEGNETGELSEPNGMDGESGNRGVTGISGTTEVTLGYSDATPIDNEALSQISEDITAIRGIAEMFIEFLQVGIAVVLVVVFIWWFNKTFIY